MTAGRPSDYRPEYCEQIIAYFNVPAGEDIEVENSKGQMQVVRRACDLPTMAGFACEIGVHRATMLTWCEQYPEFRDAYNMAKEHQERILVQNGLKEGYHANFAIFTAKNVIGWRDKVDTELSGPGGGPIQIDKLERVIVRPHATDSNS